MERKPELDGVRGLAILLVLIWHFFNRQIDSNVDIILAYFKLATNVTWSGVDLFFVLSGYLIGGILLDHRHCSNYYQVFYIRRACRIFPLYFATVLLFLVLSQNYSPAYAWLFAYGLPAWSYLTFTQNFVKHSFEMGPHWIGVTWSLAVEEQFYLVLPMLIRFIGGTALVIILLFFIALAPVFRSWIGGVGSFEYSFCRADSLLTGVLLAWLYRKPRCVRWLTKYRTACWCILTTIILFTSFMPLIAYGLGGVFNHLWFAMLYGFFLMCIVLFPESLLANLLRLPFLVWIGVRSYFIYLSHEPVSGLLHGAIFAAEPNIGSSQQFVVTVMSLMVVLLLASLSYRYVEAPILSFGRKFSYRASLSPNTILPA